MRTEEKASIETSVNLITATEHTLQQAKNFVIFDVSNFSDYVFGKNFGLTASTNSFPIVEEILKKFHDRPIITVVPKRAIDLVLLLVFKLMFYDTRLQFFSIISIPQPTKVCLVKSFGQTCFLCFSSTTSACL